MKLHAFKLSLLRIVDTYESLNAVYQSDAHPIFIIFCCLGFSGKVSCRLGNVVCRTSLSAVRVCWIHNMYAVSQREEGEFGFTKERFNIEKEQ